MRKPTMWFPNRFDTNRAVQAQKMARDWKFWIEKVDQFYYPCSKNKVNCEAVLLLCFRVMQIVCFLMWCVRFGFSQNFLSVLQEM